MALMKEIKTFDRDTYVYKYREDFPRLKNANAITNCIDRYELSPCGEYLVEYSRRHSPLIKDATGISVAKRGSDEAFRGYSQLAHGPLEVRKARIKIYTDLFKITDVEDVFGTIEE